MKHVIILALLISSTAAFGRSAILDDGTTDKTYKVEGKTVNVGVAVDAWKAGKIVLQCKPLATKGRTFFSSNGSVESILDCKPVERKINAKTGNETWKVIK